MPDKPKRRRRLLRDGLLVLVGYLLSPLSWWNDAFVNLPLAYGLAFLCGMIAENLFVPALVVGYWLTNIAGLLMMHYGFVGSLRGERRKFSWREVGKDLLVSLCYTLVIAVLAWMGWFKFPAAHGPHRLG